MDHAFLLVGGFIWLEVSRFHSPILYKILQQGGEHFTCPLRLHSRLHSILAFYSFTCNTPEKGAFKQELTTILRIYLPDLVTVLHSPCAVHTTCSTSYRTIPTLYIMSNTLANIYCVLTHTSLLCYSSCAAVVSSLPLHARPFPGACHRLHVIPASLRITGLVVTTTG
jgi:hypothetical protein